MIDLWVRGVGLWTPGFPDAGAWCSGRSSEEAQAPEAKLLGGAIRRRATGQTRMAVEVLQQAGRDAGCDLSSVPTVWATAHGEHETAVAILEMMQCSEGRLSPTRFHNSVYNTASGYASIATGNRAPSTTISGGRELVAVALLEAHCLLQAGAQDVIAVFADEPMRPPFDARGAGAPLALALCLSRDRAGAAARLSGLRRERAQPVPLHPRFGGLYVSAALPLLESVVAQREGRIPLELDLGEDGPIWTLRLDPEHHGPGAR